MMSNRLLIFLTLLVILAMLLLFVMRAAPFLWKSPSSNYIAFEDVRGMALVYHNIPYTLSFEQQNRVVELLNQSVPIAPQKYPKDENRADFDKLVIYRFGANDLILTPEVYVDEDLAYRVSEWNGNGLLMDISGGVLKELLNQTHDP